MRIDCPLVAGFLLLIGWGLCSGGGTVRSDSSPGFDAPRPPRFPPALEAARVAASGLPPGGAFVRWDRYVVAWVHATPVTDKETLHARDQAARKLEMPPGSEPRSLSLGRLVGDPVATLGSGFFQDTPLEAALKDRRVNVLFFADLAGLARATHVLTRRAGLDFDLSPELGLIRLTRDHEHREWLIDLLARMAWKGEGCVSAWQGMLSEARQALVGYADLQRVLEKALGAKVIVDGPEFRHIFLPPAGVWRYQEMVAFGVVQEARIRTLLVERSGPVPGRMVELALPSGWQPPGAPGFDQLLVRPQDGFASCYVLVHDRGIEWVTARLAQNSGWDLETIANRVQRDAAGLELTGATLVPTGLTGKALVLAGRFSASLALYPAALRRLVDLPFGGSLRVRAVAPSPHSLVLTRPEVPQEELPRLTATALALEASVVKEPTAPMRLRLWVDLPADGSGKLQFITVPPAVKAQVEGQAATQPPKK
ncbi:MAG: hypothetical protein HY815_20460 [Candidatus Riflebacteria bacterium]|nr:hypothetical protein [Candidatus Riflebacteria bacterium]